jgi:hypothetical protein
MCRSQNRLGQFLDHGDSGSLVGIGVYSSLLKQPLASFRTPCDQFRLWNPMTGLVVEGCQSFIEV